LSGAWGQLTQLSLPGCGKLGIYQPRHERPKPMAKRREDASIRFWASFLDER
jgi:hypothetical protein